jgi:8-oxo-dGTP pyrophosphatase MutT (NUDIX family)
MHDETEFRQGIPLRLGCLALITDHHGRALMVEKAYRVGSGRWGLPGGCAQAVPAPDVPHHPVAEEPRAAACREVREETGLIISARRLLVVHHVPATAHAVAGVNLVFDGGQLLHEPNLALPASGEIRSFRWMTPEELSETDPRTRKRVLAAIRQRADGTGTTYLTGVNDEPPGRAARELLPSS